MSDRCSCGRKDPGHNPWGCRREPGKPKCVFCRKADGTIPITTDHHVQGSLRPSKKTAYWCEPCWTAWNRRCEEERQAMIDRTNAQVLAALAAAGEKDDEPDPDDQLSEQAWYEAQYGGQRQ